MKELVETLRKGELPVIVDLLESIESLVPRYVDLESTLQDPVWHGEGNVRIHTEMVLEEVYRLIENGNEQLNESERVALVIPGRGRHYPSQLRDNQAILLNREEATQKVTHSLCVLRVFAVQILPIQ